MIKLPPGITIEERPIEIMYKGVLKGLLTRIKGLYDAIYNRYGEDGLTLIREVSAAYGRGIAQKVRGSEEPWTIEEVGLFLVKVFNNMRSDGEVTEFNDDKVAIMVPTCPYPFDKVEICQAHTSMERALVEGLNPDLDYVIERSVPAGDLFCLHVLKH